jgi:phosphoglycolate phosphatase
MPFGPGSHTLKVGANPWRIDIANGRKTSMNVDRDRLRAVIFDFDGTLADCYDAIAASVNHVRGYHHLPPLDVAEVRRHVGRGPKYLMQHTVGSGDADADVARYRAHHPTVMYSHLHFLPGAADALAAIKQTGRRAAVCSNKPRAFTLELLRHGQVAALVEVVVGPEDAASPKPAPEMLLLALTRLGVGADEALYVGDMAVDIQTARGAGVAVWVVPTGSDTQEVLLQARPDRLLRDMRELAGWLRRQEE